MQLTYEIELLDSKYEDFADLKSFEILRKYGCVPHAMWLGLK